MSFLLCLWPVTVLLAPIALASPLEPIVQSRQSITTLSSADIAAFKPYTYYASAGYCDPTITLTWTCGENCDATPDFTPIASGGNSDSVQYWFVGYDSSLEAVIVSHQGTDTSEILPLITDAEIVRTNLDSTLFPGLSTDISVHSGFAESQADTAVDVLAAVQSAMATYSTSQVTIVGHSLGAAIALIDGVYLALQLPTATVSVIGYGMPRVGNQDFADYVDASAITVSHVNNMEDYIPILPGMFLGYVHPSGEKHIMDSLAWVACPGQDNEDTQCTTGDVPSIFAGDESEHDGPYDGVLMGCY